MRKDGIQQLLRLGFHSLNLQVLLLPHPRHCADSDSFTGMLSEFSAVRRGRIDGPCLGVHLFAVHVGPLFRKKAPSFFCFNIQTGGY
jgi:hypothetical protein